MGENPQPLVPTDLVLGLVSYGSGKKNTPPAGVSTTMATFLDAYTLHDSYWMTLNVGQFESDLLIRFDAHWTGGRIPHQGPRVAKWPRLIVTMSGLVESRLDFGDIDYAASILEAKSDRHPTLDGKAISLYQLDAGAVSLVHDTTVELRMIDPAGNLIPIPL